MRMLLRLYINALLNGNPFVVGITMVVAVLVAAGPFYEQLSTGDPWAIGVAVLILAGIALVLVVAIIDRKLNPDPKKQMKVQKVGKR